MSMKIDEDEFIKNQARRIKKDGKIIILPPDGFGDAWSGSSTTESRIGKK